jgi:hypothetical protein
MDIESWGNELVVIAHELNSITSGRHCFGKQGVPKFNIIFVLN